MKVVYVDYWKDKSGEIKNFGDELNKYLIEKLTDKIVQRVDFTLLFADLQQAIKVLSYYLITGKISFGDYLQYLRIHKNKDDILLFIGSILSHCRTPNYKVWGAGIMFRKDNFHNADFRAVRGKHSQTRIEELGYIAPKVLGDPAILLPIVYRPKIATKKYKLGIIPHFKHYKELEIRFKAYDILIIDLNSPIERVVDEIMLCEKTISTSLHGVIVSHAYSIPSIWAKFEEVNHNIGGDDIKFADYFSSVEIREYSPFIIPLINKFNLELFLKQWPESFKDIDVINEKHVTFMQKKLLSVAPIRIKEMYLRDMTLPSS